MQFACSGGFAACYGTVVSEVSSWLERLLLIFGISLVSLYLANLAYSAVYSRASVQSFWISQASAQTAVEEHPQPQGSLPDLSLWSVKRIKAYQASLLANVPPPLGVLDIPSLRLQVPILEGTDDLTLDRGGRAHYWHRVA